MTVVVVGGGLAGVEAAAQCARYGVPVRLYEMRPAVTTAAHRTPLLAELVCSNSLKSDIEGTSAALLKEEMRSLGSVTLAAADAARVPAGGALAVDRDRFAAAVTAFVESCERVEVVRAEVDGLPAPPAVIASGPLTSPALAAALNGALGRDQLFFFDALAPIVAAASIDRRRCYPASRYGKGEGTYLNCRLTREQYGSFVAALRTAETAPLRDFERGVFFEGCLPLEELARRGPETLRFGPLRPVGLAPSPTSGTPYAVVQLRVENAEATMYGLVGCQTRLKVAEQRRVFRLIPALAEAEFLRYGAAHRNTYLAAPAVLEPTLELRDHPGLFIAGQLTGVEGYVEAAAAGIIAGLNVARRVKGLAAVYPPRETMLGGLLRYIARAPLSTFSPMNANWGLVPAAEGRGRGERRLELLARARAAFKTWAGPRGEAVKPPGEKRAR
jgi:methylenetetrahydrofolate--tRNA-(uracil-5-)-methyltransferase